MGLMNGQTHGFFVMVQLWYSEDQRMFTKESL